jgi:inner membrane transporter RhtA
VLCLTQPWDGAADPVGVAFALSAAGCWAAYIILTQKIGDAVSGIGGLAISMPVTAVVATLAVGPGIVGHLTPELLLAGLGLAVLLPVVPFTWRCSRFVVSPPAPSAHSWHSTRRSHC